jgi:hypothetical protein
MAKSGCGPFEPSGNFLAMGEGDGRADSSEVSSVPRQKAACDDAG